ncbi:glycosyltransferase family 1 protein [Flavobacterium magnum]|uniref:Glycosyltransferase family 1 protein n=1 Tax=Flavobacterium magnum TaxID=2162713 RepID=A0A2S0RCW4_9FLAO|nr:glycosyltransferase family 4 protein [Flavobacterium magnum]AWA29787.1 glycosyltransferase family 1 protein [Flavobacterium magnum]
MHIGFITSHYPFPDVKSVGGIGTSIRNLAAELARLGHEVTVLVYGQERDDRMEIDGIRFVTIRNVKFKGLSWWLTRRKIQRVIKMTARSRAFDVIEAPDWEGITSFITTPCPMILRLNGSDTYFCHLEKRPVKWINKFHERRAFKRADGIISVSRFTGEVTNAVFNCRRDFTVIPNGIDATRFVAHEKKKESRTVLYFGGIIRKKGVLEIPHYFNKIAATHPDARLVVAGFDMPDKLTGNRSTKEMMLKLFDEHISNRVHFTGSIPYHEIGSYIQDSAVCIFPSYAEALPVSWLEAMSMEKAVVASNIGWSNEIIEDGENGFKSDPANHDIFAQKIALLLDNPDSRENMGTKARETVIEKFSTKVTAIKSLDFYSSIIDKK